MLGYFKNFIEYIEYQQANRRYKYKDSLDKFALEFKPTALDIISTKLGVFYNFHQKELELAKPVHFEFINRFVVVGIQLKNLKLLFNPEDVDQCILYLDTVDSCDTVYPIGLSSPDAEELLAEYIKRQQNKRFTFLSIFM